MSDPKIAGPRRTVLLDVLPHSIGVVAANGAVQRVLRRNVAIPVEQSKLFSTAHDNQTEICIRIVQGESLEAQHNTELGVLTLDNLRAAPRGKVEVLVTFEVDTSGILNLTARDRDSGRIYSKRVKISADLADRSRSAELAVR